MKLKIVLPNRIFFNEEVGKIVAESLCGHFCLLPAHVDYVATLVPGLLGYLALDGEEFFVAVDEGVLVKNGQDVLVSTRQAISGVPLGELQKAVEDLFLNIDEQEKKNRTLLARMEIGIVKKFIEI